jgi:CubicO group peptidase (beta-lactamase class C family)
MHLRICLLILTFFLLETQPDFAQTGSTLPHSTPELQGVSSRDIIRFLDSTKTGKTEFHSFILIRHGNVIAEGWWDPYKPNFKHTLYSCSKSFTATAIGFAIQEKLINLDDKVTSFFPESLPDSISTNLSKLTVKDVLMMSDGQDPDPSFLVAAKDSNWIKGFLATPLIHEPGTQFLYNSLGTYMLSAIIQKVTRQKTIEYLTSRLFDPLGITGMDWETDLQGINTGGWGLRLKTEDMAKFAELFLQKGVWNGKQILPASWVEEASTMKIMQDPKASQSKKDSSDWLQGYCYQMWRCRYNAYRGDGAFGQFMIVMPDQDAVLAITAETPDMQEEINLVWKYLLPGFKNERLPDDKTGDQLLENKTKKLELPHPAGNVAALETKLNGAQFSFDHNTEMIQKMSFNFGKEICAVKMQTAKGSYKISFGSGKWELGKTDLPGPSLTAQAIENNSMIFPASIAATYTWKDPTTLELIIRYVESPHSEILTCHFLGNIIQMNVAKSFNFGRQPIVLQGKSD